MPITVTNPGISTGTTGAFFNQTFTQSGAVGGTTFSLDSGTLPMGLMLSTAGVLSGTPTQLGTFPITVKVTSDAGCTGVGPTYTLQIICPMIAVSGTIPALTFDAAMATATFTQAGGNGTITWSATGLPTGASIDSGNGQVTGTPSVTGTFSVTITATDADGCVGTKDLTVTVAPVAADDSYSGLVDNTQFAITGGATASPATPFVGAIGKITANDLPSGAVTLTAGTFATGAGGSVTIAADGTFLYTPQAHPGLAAITSDSFTYTVTSNTGGGAAVTSAPGTVSLTLAGRVWYVLNNGGAGNGQSQSSFNLLSSAIAASTANDTIFVYRGNGTSTNLATASTLKTGQSLIGEGVALVVNSNTLVAAGSFPLIGGKVTLANNVTADGFNMSTGAATAISGNGVTGIDVTVGSTTTSGAANGISVIGGSTGSLTVSGGTIGNSTADGVVLNGAMTVSLSSMTITGGTHNGIIGVGLNGFSLISSSVTNNGSANDNGIKLTDLTGTGTFTNDTVTGSTTNNVWISQVGNGTLTSLTVTNGTYGNTNNAFATATNGFLVAAVFGSNSTIKTATFTGVTFTNNFATGLVVQANSGSTYGDGVGAPATGTFTVTGCTFTGNNVAADFDQDQTANIYVRFVNNTTLTGQKSTVLNFFSGANSTGGTFKALVSGNTIGTAGVVSSGSLGGNGIRVFMQGKTIGTLNIVNNTIRGLADGSGFAGRGIDVEELGHTGNNQSQTPLDVKITNNDVDPQDTSGFPLYAIYAGADAQGTGTSGSNVHAEIHGNAVPSSPSACDTQCSGNIGMIFFETVSGATGATTGTLFNFGAGATVSAEIAAQNAGTAGKTCSFQNGGSLTLGGAAVTTVP